MPKEKLQPVELNDAQKRVIDEYWHLDLRTLTQKVFDNPRLTLRHIESRAVRQYLATLGKEVVTPQPERQESLIADLTEEQQTYIRTNYQDSNPLEMARVLYQNAVLLPTAKEVQTVQAYCRKIDPSYRRDDDMVDSIDYVPPKSIVALAARLNQYEMAKNTDGSGLFNDSKFTGQQRMQLEALLSKMKLPSFRVEANKFVKRIDREVFESTFIGTCWDKSDLSHEHILQFIQLASMTAKYNMNDRIVQKLDERLSATLEDPEGRLNMAEVETLNTTREKAFATAKQIMALIKTLSGERAKQVNEKIAGAGSMHPLVQSWRRADDRKRIIKLAEKKRETLKVEVERLSTMESMRAEIWGIDADSIAN